LTEKEILNIAARFGIESVGNLRFHYDYSVRAVGHETVFEPGVAPAPLFTERFWSSLAKIAKLKNEKCRNWDSVKQFNEVRNSPKLARLLKSIEGITECEFGTVHDDN